MSTAKWKSDTAGVSHPHAKGGTGARRQGSVYIHQVFPAAPGTRIMVRVERPDGTPAWSSEPILMFALVEDYDAAGCLHGERWVAPMRERGRGLFTTTCFDTDIGDVLAPGEQVPLWDDGE